MSKRVLGKEFFVRYRQIKSNLFLQRLYLRLYLKLYFKEKLLAGFFFLCAFLSILVTLSILWILCWEAYLFFRQVPPLQFFTGTRWAPLLEPRSFGVLPLFCGTLLITFLSGMIALPLGLVTAIFLSEYASARTRSILKPVLEILAGIPTVVYGYFALTFVTPLLQRIFPNIEIFNALSASIVVAIMILPMVSSLCEDALSAVPVSLREAAYSLGSTSLEVSLKVVVPAALSGIMASFILALSRAIGETMAVTLAAGSTPRLTLNPLKSIQTMTAYIVQVSLGDVPAGTIEYQTIFAVGAFLFLITLLMNILANYLVRKFRHQYE